MNQNQDGWEQERLPDAPPEEKPKQTYTPRPKWQVVLAWVLLVIVVLGVLNLCYWQLTS